MYWLLIPKHKRRKCLFKKSCSNYVYDKTKSDGFITGLKALRFRINNCNPHYTIMNLNGEQILITKTNYIIKENLISELLLSNLSPNLDK